MLRAKESKEKKEGNNEKRQKPWEPLSNSAANHDYSAIDNGTVSSLAYSFTNKDYLQILHYPI